MARGRVGSVSSKASSGLRYGELEGKTILIFPLVPFFPRVREVHGVQHDRFFSGLIDVFPEPLLFLVSRYLFEAVGVSKHFVIHIKTITNPRIEKSSKVVIHPQWQF